MNTEPDPSKLLDERLVFNRKALVFAHTLLGFFSALFYLSKVDLTHSPFFASSSGLSVIAIAAPAILPYVYSGVYSRAEYMYGRLSS